MRLGLGVLFKNWLSAENSPSQISPLLLRLVMNNPRNTFLVPYDDNGAWSLRGPQHLGVGYGWVDITFQFYYLAILKLFGLPI